MSDADDKPTTRKLPMIQSQSMTGEASVAPKAAPVPAGLLAGYQRNASAFDELLSESGPVRPHYAKLIGTLAELSPAELQHRWDTSQRFVHEQGITYNVYGDPRGMERPWQLDPIPFVIAPDEW